MSKDDDNAAGAATDDLPIDGGEMTADEKAQAEALEKEGSGDGTDEGSEEAAPAGEAEGEEGGEAAPAGDPKPDDDKGAEAGAAGEAAAAPAAPATDPEPAPAAAAQPAATPDPKPEPSQDWDKAMDALADKFDAGDIETAEYQRELRKLMREQSQHDTDVALWEDRQRRATEASAASFNAAALAWENANKPFMANPIRAKAMQDAIVAVDAQQPGLAPDKLLSEAAKVAFEAFNYTPPADAPAVDPAVAAAAVAKAKAERAKDAPQTPTTLATAPAAAAFDPSKSSFSQLDELGIDDLENALARMPADKLEDFLNDAPGAKTRGT